MAERNHDERLSKLLPYQYQPLKSPRSFRLLQLNRNLSRHGPSAVTGKLVSYDLDSCPSFTAISYVWGDSTITVPFECEGKVLRITQNCHDALQRLARRRLKRLVWVDAICIDQGNRTEKSVQVAMMGDIYTTARHVMVWFGSGSPATDDGMQRLRVCEAVHRYATCPGPLKKYRMRTYSKYVEKGFDDHLDRHGTMLAGTIGEVFCNEWFERLWVVQEAALPAISRVYVYYGDRRVPLQSCLQLAAWMMKREIVMDSDITLARAIMSCTALLITGRIGGSDNKSDTLLGLLRLTNERYASNPLDYVYALYGIASQSKLHPPTPDYNKSVVAVFTETVRYIAEEEKELRFLFLTGAHQTPDLPSWVPDFSLPIPFHINLKAGSAALLSNPCWSFDTSGLRLTTRGTILEAVKTCGPAMPMVKALMSFKRHTMKNELVRVIQTTGAAWIEMAEAECTTSPASDPSFSIRCTLQLEEPSDSEPVNERKFFSLDLLKHMCDPQADHIVEFSSGQIQILTTLYRDWAGKRFIITESGRVGMASLFTEPGDRIALLSGLETPFIVRQQGSDYRLLGPAFVYSIMNGQAWPEDESELRDITFI